jgi:hypothetical protein
LCLTQDFSYYLNRSNKKNNEKTFSSVNFHGEIAIPMSKSVTSNMSLNENTFLPNLPVYFGLASLTPKFKVIDMGSNTINLLVNGTYICRPYDFRPGANWYTTSIGISVDSKRVLAEIASIRVMIVGGNMGDTDMMLGNSVNLTINIMPLFHRATRPQSVSPVSSKPVVIEDE